MFDPLWPYNMDMYNYYIYKCICTFCSDFIYVYLTLPPIIMEVGNGFLRNLFPLLFGSICHWTMIMGARLSSYPSQKNQEWCFDDYNNSSILTVIIQLRSIKYITGWMCHCIVWCKSWIRSCLNNWRLSIMTLGLKGEQGLTKCL